MVVTEETSLGDIPEVNDSESLDVSPDNYGGIVNLEQEVTEYF